MVERAGLEPKRGRGWHSLRRKFASDLMNQPLKVLCEPGGWKPAQTVFHATSGPTKTGSGRPPTIADGPFRDSFSRKNGGNQTPEIPFVLMGLGRLELPTSRLSGVRSNHLSYRPRSRPRCRDPAFGASA